MNIVYPFKSIKFKRKNQKDFWVLWWNFDGKKRDEWSFQCHNLYGFWYQILCLFFFFFSNSLREKYSQILHVKFYWGFCKTFMERKKKKKDKIWQNYGLKKIFWSILGEEKISEPVCNKITGIPFWSNHDPSMFLVVSLSI